MLRYALAAMAALFTSPTLAHEITAGDLTIIHPHIPAPAKGAKVAGGYMVIANDGAAEDALIGVTVDFADAQLHKSEVGADGMATMIHQDRVPVPAHGTTSFEPGGLHVMFMGVNAPLSAGMMVPATLLFEKAGAIRIEFMVDAPGAAMDPAMHMDPDMPMDGMAPAKP